MHEVRSRAGRCAAAASHIKVEAQGEEKLEDLLDLGGAERLSIGLTFQWDQDKNIEFLLVSSQASLLTVCVTHLLFHWTHHHFYQVALRVNRQKSAIRDMSDCLSFGCGEKSSRR